VKPTRTKPLAFIEGIHATWERAIVARPTGVGCEIATYTIPIEGRDEWLAAAWRMA
jgi:hypothetical protein